jgi:hypothetical protein
MFIQVISSCRKGVRNSTPFNELFLSPRGYEGDVTELLELFDEAEEKMWKKKESWKERRKEGRKEGCKQTNTHIYE